MFNVIRRILPALFLCIFSTALFAAAGDAPASLPEGVKGFKGTLSGTVVSNLPDGLAFTLKVTKSTPEEGNKATTPANAVGNDLLINAQWKKDENGRWRAIADQVQFIKDLKVGQELAIRVVNDGMTRLHIVALPEK